MKKYKLLTLILLVACGGRDKPAGNAANDRFKLPTGETYAWTRLLDSAAWKKSYNFQMFGIGDSVWTFHPDGNWFSTDGSNWSKSSLTNAISNLAFLDYIPFDNGMYGLGHFEGNIEQFSFHPEIYKTVDLKDWDTLTRRSNLPARFFYHPFVFDKKLWIIGGEDKTTLYADIWNSTDGVNWKKQQDSPPFGRRSGSQVVYLNGKLLLLNNDVWTSSDALHWERVTGGIIAGEQVFGYSPVVYDNKIWLLGCNRNGQFSSQVLVSTDGKNWSGYPAPWSPRGGIASTVFKGKIYMTGGKYGGTPDQPEFRYSNDLWTLEKVVSSK